MVADLQHQLGDDLVVVRGPLARASLRLRVLDLPSQAERLAWLAREVPALPGTGIVYCLTIEDTNRVTRWLRRQGIDAMAYSGQTLPEDRVVIETALSENRVKAVVATSALGMGYDKPDLGFVVHFQSPGSPIAYYQQIGRAGRALDRAEVVLLRGHEDRDIQDWFIDTAFPEPERCRGRAPVPGRERRARRGRPHRGRGQRPPIADSRPCSRSSRSTVRWAGSEAAGTARLRRGRTTRSGSSG